MVKIDRIDLLVLKIILIGLLPDRVTQLLLKITLLDWLPVRMTIIGRLMVRIILIEVDGKGYLPILIDWW